MCNVMQSRNLEQNYWKFIVGCTHSLCKLKLGYSFHAVAKKSEKQRHEMKLHRACRTIVCVKWDCFFMWFLLTIIYLLLISVAPYCTNLTQQYNAIKLCISNHCYRLPYMPYCSHQTKFFLQITSQSRCLNFIDNHVSLQSFHVCDLNTIAWVVEVMYLHSQLVKVCSVAMVNKEQP